jgi:hypothetical protein
MEEKQPIKEYADGWITEKEGTEVPGFLKGVYVVMGLGCCSYFILYMNGEVDHADRGALVTGFNKATTQADGFMFAVAGMALIYVLCVLLFAFRSGKHE